MIEKNSSEFKINIDDEESDAQYDSDISEHKLEKLNQRIVFLSILFPCIIGVFLLFGYLDLKNRVATTRDSGTVEMKNLSKELETSLTDLSTRLVEIKKEFPSKVTTIEKQLAELSAGQKKINEALNQINKYKASKKSLKKTRADLGKVAAIIKTIETGAKKSEADIQQTKADIKQLDTKLDQEIAVVSETAKKALMELKKFEAKTAEIEADQLNAKDVEAIVANARNTHSKNLASQLTEINKRIEALQKKISGIRNGNNNKPANRINVPLTKPNNTSTSLKPLPKPGGIKEKDIAE